MFRPQIFCPPSADEYRFATDCTDEHRYMVSGTRPRAGLNLNSGFANEFICVYLCNLWQNAERSEESPKKNRVQINEPCSAVHMKQAVFTGFMF